MSCCKKSPDAIAWVQGGEDAPQLSGHIRFYQEKGCVLIEARVAGLPKENKTGFFAFHIHTGSDCGGDRFENTGSHYAPGGQEHPEHAGDLPPLMRYGQNAYMAVRTDRFCVEDIFGRTVVIHSDPDDFHSQPAGNAGRKIACGLICRGQQQPC